MSEKVTVNELTKKIEELMSSEQARKEHAERMEKMRRDAERISRTLEGRKHSDSGELQHEGRNERLHR